MEVTIKGTAKEIADLVQAIQDRQGLQLDKIQLDTSCLFSDSKVDHTLESPQRQQTRQRE